MNRIEALHILGVEDDATPNDIKLAYRETVQILHPDKFAGNEKLQNRATEQFKRLQEAYDLLMKDSGSRRRSAQNTSSDTSDTPRSWTTVEDGQEVEYLTIAEVKARLAGIAAARMQLAAQRDMVSDDLRNGAIMAGIGLVAALFGLRRPFGILGVIGALGGAAAIWGAVQVISALRNRKTLDAHLAALSAERKEYENLLDEA